MKRLILVATIVVCSASHCVAQEPKPARPDHNLANIEFANLDDAEAASMANLSPQMWFYLQQLQRHDEPQMAVRRKAEQRAAQRSNRIASRKWFGLSNARPSASPTPVMGSYAPYWAGNDSDPNRWNGVGPAAVQVDRTIIDLRR